MRPDLIINRSHLPDDWGTFSVVTSPYDIPELRTVELPWKNNAPFISCIPPGTYKCIPWESEKFDYPCIKVLGVPGRTGIVIHRANKISEILGCIGPGMHLGMLDDQLAVLESEKALDLIVKYFGDRESVLQIRDYRANYTC
jgi:hypothetical protein